MHILVLHIVGLIIFGWFKHTYWVQKAYFGYKHLLGERSLADRIRFYHFWLNHLCMFSTISGLSILGSTIFVSISCGSTIYGSTIYTL